MSLKDRNLESEFRFSATRSSGKGGQYVNKVSSKIELIFDIRKSAIMNEEEKKLIYNKLKNRIDKKGVMRIVSQHGRSQFTNKTKAVNRLFELLDDALIPEKIRKKSRPKKKALLCAF